MELHYFILQLPDPSKVEEYREPYVLGTLVFPEEYMGKMITLCQVYLLLFLLFFLLCLPSFFFPFPFFSHSSLLIPPPLTLFFLPPPLNNPSIPFLLVINPSSFQSRRGEQLDVVYIDENRVMLKYMLPLSEIIIDFYDELKSLSSGYAR